MYKLDENYISSILNLKKLTKDQQHAIVCKTPALICASAGSGKTFTLCNRILFKLLNPKNNITAQDILIVSFTKAAANEIFNRIKAKLQSLIQQFPNNNFFKKQMNFLNQNCVTTIDSFCSNFLKENFEHCKISPNFKIGNEIEMFSLKQKIITNIFIQENEKNPKNFQQLIDYFSLNSSDILKKAILTIFEKSRTNPFPEQFLNNLTKLYKNPTSIDKNIKLTNPVKQEIIDRITHAQFLILSSQNYMNDPILKKNFEPILMNAAKNLKALAHEIESNTFSKINEKILNFEFESLPRYNKKNNNFDLELAKFIKSKFLIPAKKIINSIKQLQITNAQFINDCKIQKPIIYKLVNLCFKFAKNLETYKQSENIIEFSDLLIKTINVLAKPVKNEPTNFQLTTLGKLTQNKFKEILIDEFQDINKPQELLFKILSQNNKNLFAVGDLKQSIYRFRQAEPEIFLNYIENFKKNNKTIIYLKHNFRSHFEITNSINFLFSQIMTKNFGGANYKATETLASALNFKPSKQHLTELHILTTNKNSCINKNQFTMKYIAEQIYNLIKSKFQVTENDHLTSCQPKHCAVLFRSDNQLSNFLCEELTKLNIPFQINNKNEFLKTYEISILISILKIIDNPLDDIAFCAICLSPILNFSTKTIFEIKSSNNQTSIFMAFTNSKNKTCLNFIEKILNLRQQTTQMPPSQLIQKIYNSKFFNKIIINNLKESKQILNNFQNFLNFVNDLEQNEPNLNLKNLINILKTKNEFNLNFHSQQSNTITQLNAVQIMTIHKSKGLQFPIVFLAMCEKKFNEQDFHMPLIVSNKFGIGLKHSEPKKLMRYNTLPFNCIAIDEKNQAKAEELRLLYVAMTRAQQKLFLIANDNDNKFKNTTLPKQTILPESFCRNKTSFYDWLIAGFFRHKNSYFKQPKINFKEQNLQCSIIIKNKLINKHTSISKKKTQNSNTTKIDFKLIEKIKNAINYKANKNELCNTPAKLSVSEITKNQTEINLKNLSFEEKITKAEIGTTFHKFLQHANFINAKLNLENEISNLINNKFISKKQASYLNKTQLTKFLNSNIINLIKNANKIERERNFIVALPIDKIINHSKNQYFKNEKIIIQGSIDLLLEKNNKLTIVDYKTDKATNEALKKRYKNQLKIYKTSIEILTKKPVELCLIYSFFSNSQIKI